MHSILKNLNFIFFYNETILNSIFGLYTHLLIYYNIYIYIPKIIDFFYLNFLGT